MHQEIRHCGEHLEYFVLSLVPLLLFALCVISLIKLIASLKHRIGMTKLFCVLRISHNHIYEFLAFFHICDVFLREVLNLHSFSDALVYI